MNTRILRWFSAHRWAVAFTFVHAVLAAYVFWGTWSPDFAPVMPDCPVTHTLSASAQFREWWNGLCAGNAILPTELIWGGPFCTLYLLQEFKFALAGYLSALGLAYFLRGRGLSALASYGAGLLLGFCGYWFSLFSAGHGGWFIWMSYGTFAFGLLDRAIRFRSPRHWILSGAVVAWGSFAQPDLWLLFTVLTGFYALAVCAFERRFPWKGMLVAALTFAVIGAPSVRNAFTGSLAQREKQIAETVKPLSDAEKADPAAKAKAEAEARWIFTTNWSLPPDETIEFVRARVNGDTSCPMTLQLGRAAGKDVKPYTGALGRPLGAPQGNYRQHSLYVGWITCLFALCGIVFAIKPSDPQSLQPSNPPARPLVLFFTVAAILCWLFSLGRYCEPVYRLVYMLPFGDTLRAPVKWHHLTEFCLCVLAGFGIDSVCAILARKAGALRATVAVAVVVLCGAMGLAHLNSLYCAPIDLRLVRGGNAVADFVNKSGKGAVADLVGGGNGLLSWSFSAHGVGTTGNPAAEGVRFVFAGLQQVRSDKRLADFLQARAKPVGTYLLSQKGIFAVQGANANAALYQMNGVPAPADGTPVPNPGFWVRLMGVVSTLATFAVAFVCCRAKRFSSSTVT